MAPDRAIPVGAVVVRVPPQTVADAFATVNPTGNVSLNATPVSATVLAAGLVMVNVSDVVALRAIVDGLKTLAIDGGATTVSIAVLLVVPVPPSVEVTAPVVLLLLPAVVPVTSAEKVQVEPAPGDAVNVPPDRLMVPLPAVAVIVPLPQEPVTFGVFATTTPAGKLSVKATPLSALAVFGLVMVKLSVLLAFRTMLVGLKALLIVGGATTVIEAFEVLPVTPPALVAVGVTLLFLTPAVVPCTVTDTVQDVFGATLAPKSETVDEPLAAVAVPPHVLLKLPGVATTNPAGRLSVKATPLSVRFWLLLLSRVKVRLVVLLSGIDAAPKALTICGGLMTVRIAVLLVTPGPLSVASITPVVLLATPSVVPVTFTVIVHCAPPAKVPPVRLIEFEPATAVTDPPQTPLNPFGVATSRLAGKVSLNVIPDNAMDANGFVFGLLIVNVRLVVPLMGMFAAPNALLIVGGKTMSMLAVVV